MPRAKQKKRDRRKRLAATLRDLIRPAPITAAPALHMTPKPWQGPIVQLLRDLNRAGIRWEELAEEIGYSKNERQRLRSLITQRLRELIRQAQEADKREMHLYRRPQANAQTIRLYGPPPGDGALARLLREMDQAGIPLWPLVEEMDGSKEEREMLRAITAQVVAPHLAGMTPGNFFHRRKLGEGQRHRSLGDGLHHNQSPVSSLTASICDKVQTTEKED